MPVLPLPAISPASAGPSLSAQAIDTIAHALAHAHRSGMTWQPDEAWREITAADAYAIQAAVATRLGWFPEGPRAWKVGGTTDISAAPVPEVLAAHTEVRWRLPAGQEEVLVEAELAFRLTSTPPPSASFDEVLRALGTVCVAVELIGTRLCDGLSAPANWKLADQGVHAGLLIGPEQACGPFLAFTLADWQAQACHIRVAGGPHQETCGGHPAIQAGHSPLATLPWLLRHAHAQAHKHEQAPGHALRDDGLRLGDLVTTGAWLVVRARRGEVLDIGFAGMPGVQLRIA